MSDNEFKLNQTRVVESSTLYEGYNGDYASTNALGEESEADYPRFDRGDDGVEWAITGALGEEATPIYPQEERRLGDERVDQEDFPMMTTNALGEEGDAEPVGTIGSPNPNPHPEPIIIDRPPEITYQEPKIEDYEPPVSSNRIGTIGSPNPNPHPEPIIIIDEPKVVDPIECYGPEENDVAPTIKVKVLPPIECYDGSEEGKKLGDARVDQEDFPMMTTNALGEEGDADFPKFERDLDDVEWAITGALGEEATPIYPQENGREDDVAPTIKVTVEDPIECYGTEENDVAPTIKVGGIPPMQPQEPKAIDIECPPEPIECGGAPVIKVDGVPPKLAGYPKVVDIECYGENEGTPLNDLPTWEPTIYLGDDFIIEKDVRDMFAPEAFPETSFSLEDVISTGEDNLDNLLGYVDSESAPKEVAGQDTARFVETDYNAFNMQQVDVDII